MKTLKQYRFHTDGFDTETTEQMGLIKFKNGSEFFNSNSSTAPKGVIVRLKIQGLPGTVFYLNNNTYPIMIGSDGVFNLDFEGIRITDLRFDLASLNRIIEQPVSYPLIVDAVYESED